MASLPTKLVYDPNHCGSGLCFVKVERYYPKYIRLGENEDLTNRVFGLCKPYSGDQLPPWGELSSEPGTPATKAEALMDDVTRKVYVKFSFGVEETPSTWNLGTPACADDGDLPKNHLIVWLLNLDGNIAEPMLNTSFHGKRA